MNGPPPEAIALGRIDADLSRLRKAGHATDQMARDFPDFGAATQSGIRGSLTRTERNLTALQRRIARRGVTNANLGRLSVLTTATDRVVRESFLLAYGVLARRQSLDQGACAEADLLIAELAGCIDARLARPTVPADTEFLHRAFDVIRRRVPDDGVWDLPVMGHEFGHVLVAHLQLYDPVNDQVTGVGSEVLGAWPDCSTAQGEELFCDALATFSVGPAYVCTVLLQRLNPSADARMSAGDSHPSDAVRAAVVLECLRKLTQDEPQISRLRTLHSYLAAAWAALQQRAPDAARVTDAQREAFAEQTRNVTQFLLEDLGQLRYAWPGARVRALVAELNRPAPSAEPVATSVRDVMNVAWLLRLQAAVSGTQLPAQVGRKAQQMIADIAESQFSHD